MFNNFSKIVPFEIMWKNIAELDRPQMAIWHICIACWISKATNTHTQNMYYLLLSHCNNGCMNMPPCHVTHTLPILYNISENKLSLLHMPFQNARKKIPENILCQSPITNH